MYLITTREILLLEVGYAVAGGATVVSQRREVKDDLCEYATTDKQARAKGHALLTSPDFHASVELPPAAAFEDSAPGEGKACVIVVIMVEVWWSLLGAAVPAVIAGQAFRLKRKRAEEQRIKSARGREKSADDIFVCERVCTSKRMLKKVGAFSKDPIPDTCVTVCGVSELDACSDACARTVCVNQHQVPNWNDVCLRRCQSECLKLSASRSS
ncbi:hypothetical protein Fot_20782 [Forsythia ovata]|uniref:Uncharacterized protein n=2 Tax=Forsythieae TaxID=426104 RepID=A0ABD1UT00_9LAMI